MISDAPVVEGASSRLGTPFQQWLGLKWLNGDEPAEVVVEMAIRDDLRGPAGILEGGVVGTLIDVAGASAAARVAKQMVATQSMSVSLLAPGQVGPIRAIGTVVRAGRSDAVSEVRVVDVGNEERLVAIGLVTLRLVGDKR